jgi:isoleucyl-tRNA synthetase
VRNRFVLKLWNTYAFFCNYARLDGFDPAAPAVPMERRPDLDRWILSDLQALVQQANAAFELYNLASFCLEAEQFVDDRLSNWYIRRSRRRFWKSEQGDDKLAAYQTLYTVLRVLTRLCAPIVPFLTEAIWQNIRETHDPASVHLTDYPKADASLIDTALSDEVNALLRVVSLGLSARNTAKIKVRQPLAELVVQAGDDAEQRAVTRFGEQIAEELNVKAVRLHDATNGDLLVTDVKANLKTLGPKAGGQLQAVKKQLEAMPASEVRKHLATPTPWELAGVVLTAEDVTFTDRAPEGWSGVADRATQVMLDVRLTDALKSEGLAREIVRHVQDQRKKAGLQPEDRIALVLESPAEVLQQAITDHGDTIRGETLAVTATLPDGASHRAEVQIEGLALSIALAKVTVI